MTPGTVFVSHRSEYASLVNELKQAIQTASRGEIKVFTSEDIAGAANWRAAIQSQLEEAESLFLIYGAAYENWSWCFFETGFFAGIDAAQKQSRKIYCIARPDVPPPSPLSDLQVVTGKEQLIAGLIELFETNKVEYDPVKLRESIDQPANGLFGKLAEFEGYPRVYFEAQDSAFDASPDLPACSVLKGDRLFLAQLFGIGKDGVEWNEITKADAGARAPQEELFFRKWVDETSKIILAARENKFIAPQTVLIAGGGMRFRFLLYRARVQGDGLYSCEFLVIEDVGGPALGLSQQLLALLTTIRLGFRFRYELMLHFGAQDGELSDAERRARIEEIPRIIENLLTESDARGNITLEDLQGAFDGDEADRIAKLAGYWPVLKEHLYDSLGVSADGKPTSELGLLGPNLAKYQTAFESLRLLNIEFLSRCCGRVSRMIVRSKEDLRQNAEKLDSNLSMLKAPQTKAA